MLIFFLFISVQSNASCVLFEYQWPGIEKAWRMLPDFFVLTHCSVRFHGKEKREKSWEIITAWNKPRTWNTSGERHPDTLFIFSSFFSLERMLNWPEGNRGGKLFSFPFCATGASRKRWQSENYQIRRCQFEFHPNVDQKKKKRLAAKCTHKTHFDGAFGI